MNNFEEPKGHGAPTCPVKEAEDAEAGTFEDPNEDTLLMSEPGETDNQNITMTKSDLDKCISDAVQRVIGNINLAQILGQLTSGATRTDAHTRHTGSPFMTPNFSFPKYDKEDKLAGTKNYVVWRQRFELDLRTNRLSSYIVHELGNEDLPIDQKSQFDAAVLRHLRATTSHEISNSLLRFKTAYHAFKHIEVYYGGKKLQELIRLELRARRLHFAEHYKPVQFITDFENIIDEYKELGTTFDEETLVAKFLAAIDCRHIQGHPYAIYYNTMLSLPTEQRTFEYVKQSFLNIDNSNLKKTFTDRRQIQSPTSNDDNPPKRFRSDRNNSTPTTTTKSYTTLPVTDLLKKPRVYLSDLYNERQREKLSGMSKEEKKKNQCETCNTYFHRSTNCMFKTPLCYNCFKFGHATRKCTAGNFLDCSINNMNIDSFKDENIQSRNILDAKTVHLKTLDKLFQTSTTFMVDSGATHHAVPNETILHEFHRYVQPLEVRLAINDAIVTNTSNGYGNILMLITFGNAKHILKLHNVQLIPNLTENVLSVRKFNAQYHTSFNLNTNNGSIYSRETKTKIGLIRVMNELYRLPTRICRPHDLQRIEKTFDSIDFSSLNVYYSDVSINKTSIKDTIPRKISRNKLRKSRMKLTTEKIRLLESEGDIIHARFGHISPVYLNRLRNAATGLNEFLFNKTVGKCLICAKAKMTRKSFTDTRENARHPCEIIHTDLISYSPPAIRTSDNYLLTVVDNYTRYLQVYPLKSKTEVSSYLDKALNNLQTMFYPQYPFRYLQSDNGTEFINSEIETILKKFGMQSRLSEPYEHEHNGLIERVNRTVEERVRALLFNSGFPSSYWGLAAQCASYLYNRTPHATLGFITPYEKVHSSPPDVSNIRIFGSRTAVHNPIIPKGNKTQARANVHYLVGYTPTGYLTLDPITKKTHAVCSVKIDETIQYKHDYPKKNKDELTIQPIDRNSILNETPADHNIPLDTDNPNNTTVNETPADHNIPLDTNNSDNTNSHVNPIPSTNPNEADTLVTQTDANDSDSDYEIFETEIEEEINLDIDWETNTVPISIQKCSLSSIYDPELKFDSDVISVTKVPITYNEAISGQDRLKWLPAIKQELHSMNKHNVWTIIPREKDMSVVPVKWVFGIKKDGRHKARLVVIGCRDTEKYTPADKATPTPSSDTIRWLLAHVSYSKINLIQLDITTAFLHADIDRLKYISIPPGVQGNKKNQVCKLNRALYGLTTAPKCWYQTFDTKLRSYGFERSIREPCLYSKNIESFTVIALVYVDDVLLSCENDLILTETITQISKDFEVKNLGFPTKFLGIDITIDTNKIISLSQEQFLEKVLREFKMDDSHPVRNPMLRDNDYSKLTRNQTNFPYKNVLGNLMWLANYTRPDIAYSVNFLARFQANPSEEHWIMLKRIMRYLNGTQNSGLTFDQRSSTILDTFVDSSFMDDPTTKKSTTGYLIRYRGNVIAWKSRLQRSMSMSTTHAEYIAICDTSTNLLFLANLINETLNVPTIFPIPLHEDNSACVTVCEKTISRTRLNYLDKPYLLVRELFEQNKLKPVKVTSKEQIADIFTKPLTGDQFKYLSSKLITQIK